MAVQRGLESCHPAGERLFSDPLAPLFVSRGWRLVLLAARLGPARRLIERLYDQVGGPGPRASAVARTRLIDDEIAAAADATRQVVILGAGYDSRAYRLSALSGSTVYAVDHPATQARARDRLARAHAVPVCPVRFVAVDFEHDDPGLTLLACGYDPVVRSLILWEGVTNYLTARAVDATLEAVHRLASPGSTLLFTYVDRAALEQGAAAFPEAARWITAVTGRGEPWTFGLHPAEVGDYLAQRGFLLASDSSTAEAGERYFAPRGRSERGSRLYHVVTASVGPPGAL